MEKPKLLNPLTLAFIGDSVYEVLVRKRVIEEMGSMSPKKLHILTVERVNATYQCGGYEKIKDILTEEETEIFKRGRNSSSVTVPKSAGIKEYRAATGLEALFGFLYLEGRFERIEELFEVIWQQA